MLLRAAGHQVVCSAADGDESVALLSTQPAAGTGWRVDHSRATPSSSSQIRVAIPVALCGISLSHADPRNRHREHRIPTQREGGERRSLTDTLTRIGQGEIVIEPVLVKRLVDRGRGEKKDVVAALSDREQEVLKLMTEGRSNNGIAGQLYITPKAVEST